MFMDFNFTDTYNLYVIKFASFAPLSLNSGNIEKSDAWSWSWCTILFGNKRYKNGHTISMLILLSLLVYTGHTAEVNYSSSSWVVGSPLMPRADHGFSVGYWNDTIFLLGGAGTPQALVQLNITTHNFTDLTANNLLTTNISGRSQTSTQIGSVLYSVNQAGAALSSFDLATTSFNALFSNLNVTVSDYGSSCITSTSESIYIVGGGLENAAMRDFQVLDLATMSWTLLPNMTVARGQTGCIIHGEYLYAVGGYDNGWLASMERTDLVSFTWQMFGNLAYGVSGHRLVGYVNNILALGGYINGEVGGYSTDEIQVIDTITGFVYVNAVRMSYEWRYAALITVNDIVYTFGGNQTFGGSTDKWQYYILPDTVSPTKSPTNVPTGSPTTEPTLYPTAAPSNAPTSPPTLAPSKAPTTPPSNAPTSPPTLAPSTSPTYPTNAPSNAPTSPPTIAPSKAPTTPPSNAPTSPPTLAPSTAPTHPTNAPTFAPSISPTSPPSTAPSNAPSNYPTTDPTNDPTADPTMDPTDDPTEDPTMHPSEGPTEPTTDPTTAPSFSPSDAPTNAPTICLEGTFRGRMAANDYLWSDQNDSLVSNNCKCRFWLSGTGNLLVFEDGEIKWNANTSLVHYSDESVSKFVVNNDGSVVLYEYPYKNVPSMTPKLIWRTTVENNNENDTNITMNNDHNFILYLTDYCCLNLVDLDHILNGILWTSCIQIQSTQISIANITEISTSSNGGNGGKGNEGNDNQIWIWVILSVGILFIVLVALIVYKRYANDVKLNSQWITSRDSNPSHNTTKTNPTFKYKRSVTFENDDETTKQINEWMTQTTEGTIEVMSNNKQATEVMSDNTEIQYAKVELQGTSFHD